MALISSNSLLRTSWSLLSAMLLSLINDSYKYRMDLVTNGVVITDAIKFVKDYKEELLNSRTG